MTGFPTFHRSEDGFTSADPRDSGSKTPLDYSIFADLTSPGYSPIGITSDNHLKLTASSQYASSALPNYELPLFVCNLAESPHQTPRLLHVDQQVPGQHALYPSQYYYDHSTSSLEDQHSQSTMTEPKLSKQPQIWKHHNDATRKTDRSASKKHDNQHEKLLERNRISSNKHRKRKKEFISTLESCYHKHLELNHSLKEEVSKLREETVDLHEILFTHAQCDNSPIRDYIDRRATSMHARHLPKE